MMSSEVNDKKNWVSIPIEPFDVKNEKTQFLVDMLNLFQEELNQRIIYILSKCNNRMGNPYMNPGKYFLELDYDELFFISQSDIMIKGFPLSRFAKSELYWRNKREF